MHKTGTNRLCRDELLHMLTLTIIWILDKRAFDLFLLHPFIKHLISVCLNYCEYVYRQQIVPFLTPHSDFHVWSSLLTCSLYSLVVDETVRCKSLKYDHFQLEKAQVQWISLTTHRWYMHAVARRSEFRALENGWKTLFVKDLIAKASLFISTTVAISLGIFSVPCFQWRVVMIQQEHGHDLTPQTRSGVDFSILLCGAYQARGSYRSFFFFSYDRVGGAIVY